MDYNIYYNRLYETMISKVGSKTTLVTMLRDLLKVEREAIYRRLRGEVPFSFLEIAIISKHMNISLDSLIRRNDQSNLKPCEMSIMTHTKPTEADYGLMEKFISFLEGFKDKSHSRGGEATNILPQPLYFPYEGITRFYMFKWMYHNDPTPYRKILISDRLRELQLENVKVARYLKVTDYVFDKLLFFCLVNDLKYFSQVHLISKPELIMIKTELLQLLDELQRLAEVGTFPGTNSRARLYITDINMDTSYCYFESEELKISMMKAFVLNGIDSYDEQSFQLVKSWFRSLKRQAALISENSEKQRVIYFKEQRSLVNTL